MFANQHNERSKSENEKVDSDDSKDSSAFTDGTFRKRKISTDGNVSRKKRLVSHSEESDSGDDSDGGKGRGTSSEKIKRFRSFKRKPKVNQRARPHISHPPRKRSISPDTVRVIKKLKRKHKEGSIRRKIRKDQEKRERNKRKRLRRRVVTPKRKRLRRRVVTPKYIEPSNTDDEVDNVSDTDLPREDVHENIDVDENRIVDENWDEAEDGDVDAIADKNIEPAGGTDDDESSSDDEDVTHPSVHVNCVSVEDLERVRKAIKNYNTDTVVNDVNGLNVIRTLFKGMLEGWIPICTSQQQMFSENAVEFMRKVKKSKIIDLHPLIRKNKQELENIFNFVDKSIKLVVDSYNKFGIADEDGDAR